MAEKKNLLYLMTMSWHVWKQSTGEWSTTCHNRVTSWAMSQIESIHPLPGKDIFILENMSRNICKWVEPLSLLSQSPLNAKFATEVTWMKSLGLIINICFWERVWLQLSTAMCLVASREARFHTWYPNPNRVTCFFQQEWRLAQNWS